jgi:hypothetical protein
MLDVFGSWVINMFSYIEVDELLVNQSELVSLVVIVETTSNRVMCFLIICSLNPMHKTRYHHVAFVMDLHVGGGLLWVGVPCMDACMAFFLGALETYAAW